jgi:DNA mismatch repair protein MutS
VGKDQRVPLAGIPHHALDSYLAKLIAKGYKVAICEQMEQPGQGKKIVERQVVRVVSPGTLVEDNLLQRGANNYLAALAPGNGAAGLAYVDVSTGEFACTQLDAGGDALAAELDRLSPAELLLPQGVSPPEGVKATLAAVRRRLRRAGRSGAAAVALRGALVGGLGLAGYTPAAIAAGAVIAYLQENQKALLPQVSRISYYRGDGFMGLDAVTRRNLELFASLRADTPDSSLLAVIDETRTAMGARLLRRWLGQPLLDVVQISRRQDGVQLFFDSAVRRGRVSVWRRCRTRNDHHAWRRLGDAADPVATARPGGGPRDSALDGDLASADGGAPTRSWSRIAPPSRDCGADRRGDSDSPRAKLSSGPASPRR